MTTYKYNYTGKYLPTDVWEMLDEPTTMRIRLQKDTTGCGATYGCMLHTTTTKRIIVMPTVNLIKDKQRLADTGVFGPIVVISLHADSPHTFDDIDGADIVLTTPDQMVKLFEEDPIMFKALAHESLVIDEEHAAEVQSAYRIAFRKLNVIMEHHWTGHIFTITATPPFTTTPFLDTFDILEMVNSARPQTEILATNDRLAAWGKIEEWLLAGEKVVVVTNDIKHYIRLQNKKHSVYTITGSNLHLKLIHQRVDGGDVYKNQQIILLSSSATEGIDLNFKAHVAVLSEFGREHTHFSLQSIVQAMGRPRAGLLESLVYVKKPKEELLPLIQYNDVYNSTQDIIKALLKTYTLSTQLNDKLAKQPDILEIGGKPYIDTQLINSYVASNINNNLFFADDWITQCNARLRQNKITFKAFSMLAPIKGLMQKRTNFAKSIQTHAAYNAKERRDHLHRATLGIIGGPYGAFSPNIAVAITVADICEVIPDQAIKASLLKQPTPQRALQKLNAIAIACSSFASTKGKTTMAIAKAKQEYGHLPSFLTEKQVTLIQTLHYLAFQNDYADDLLKVKLATKVFATENEEKKQFNVWRNQLKELAALVLNDCTVDRQQVDETRMYSAIAHLPISVTMKAYPYDIVEIDITSANPTFIDKLIGSKKAGTIYADIMQIENITRDEAKVRYNKLLNESWNHTERYNTLLKWQYTPDEAQYIIDNTQEKGRMWTLMTSQEQLMVERMLDITPHENKSRRHDSVVMFGKQADLEVAVSAFQANCPIDIPYHINRSYQKPANVIPMPKAKTTKTETADEKLKRLLKNQKEEN